MKSICTNCNTDYDETEVSELNSVLNAKQRAIYASLLICPSCYMQRDDTYAKNIR